MNPAHTNRLIHSTSPYLLQHAHNPVDWHEWGTEALEKATRENKPILVSIGYSSCHWCHVMERESFEKPAVATVMNDFFVCIKVDREERPDIDQIYMEAVQALGVNGGWPLNVFLTSDQKPFYGGTYFSPATWTQVLQNIHTAYIGNRDKIEDTAEALRQHLSGSDVAKFKQSPGTSSWNDDIETIYSKLESKFDTQWGGMDRAPKFVMPSVWSFLLRYHHLTRNENALKQLTLTLDKVAQGGIYDQLGGGFARYSVDAHWFAPHFEKMLYDNAQLVSLYSEAFVVTQDESYKRIVYETFDWLSREMTHRDGGFYSALDADSEGIEGQYYVWKNDELMQLLGKDAASIIQYYAVTPEGNWEHGNNILKRDGRDDRFLKDRNLAPDDWVERLCRAKKTLLDHRANRVRPGLDDKIITSWNAMMVSGLTDAYATFDDPRFLEAAIRNMNFITQQLSDGDVLFRSFKDRRGSTPGFLDDYAFTIQALLKLYTVTFDEHWIREAKRFMHFVVEQFFDPQEGYFYFTSAASEKLITRKKEIFDNVIPSSNAIMSQNLHRLGTIFDRQDWKNMAVFMTGSLSGIIISEPNYMSQWAIAQTEINKGLKEVLLNGGGAHALRREIQKQFFPFLILLGAEEKSELPLFEGKIPVEGKDTIYVCEQKVCKLPVHSLQEAIKQF